MGGRGPRRVARFQQLTRYPFRPTIVRVSIQEGCAMPHRVGSFIRRQPYRAVALLILFSLLACSSQSEPADSPAATLPDYGYVLIRTDSAGQLFVDDAAVTVAADSVISLGNGEHSLELRREGRESLFRNIVVSGQGPSSPAVVDFTAGSDTPESQP